MGIWGHKGVHRVFSLVLLKFVFRRLLSDLRALHRRARLL